MIVLLLLISFYLFFIFRKTRVGNIDIVQVRPPRFIGRDGIIRPYSPEDAVGNALIVVKTSILLYIPVIFCIY